MASEQARKAACEEVWAEEGGIRLRVETDQRGRAYISFIDDVSGDVMQGVTIVEFRRDRLAAVLSTTDLPAILAELDRLRLQVSRECLCDESKPHGKALCSIHATEECATLLAENERLRELETVHETRLVLMRGLTDGLRHANDDADQLVRDKAAAEAALAVVKERCIKAVCRWCYNDEPLTVPECGAIWWHKTVGVVCRASEFHDLRRKRTEADDD